MTPNEAVQQAMMNHEFRHYAPATISVRRMVGRKLVEAPMDAVVAECWCGTPTPPFLSEKGARDAHGRHQARLALMRSFGHWDT